MEVPDSPVGASPEKSSSASGPAPAPAGAVTPATEQPSAPPGEAMHHAPRDESGPRRSKIWQSEGAKVAVIGAVATAFMAALITSDRLDSLFGWGEGSSTTASTGVTSTASSTSRQSFKSVTNRDATLTLTVPADWGANTTSYNMPVAGVIDTGSGLRSGKGVGLISSNSYDEPSAWIGASVDAAKRMTLAGRGRQDYLKYVKQLLVLDDYTVDGCTYVGQREVPKVGYIAVLDTWAGCRGFSDAEFRNMYAISDDGEVFVVCQVVTVGGTRSSGDGIIASFAVRLAAVPSGKARAAGTHDSPNYPLPEWAIGQSHDLVTP